MSLAALAAPPRVSRLVTNGGVAHWCPAVGVRWVCPQCGAVFHRASEAASWAPADRPPPEPPAPRPARVRPVIPSAVHGRRATYVRGCGCPRCTAANARYVQQWRSRGCCPAVTHGARLRFVELETACGRGRYRVWPGQLALVVPAVSRARARRTHRQEGEG